MSHSPAIVEAPTAPRAAIVRRASGAMRFIAHSALEAWRLSRGRPEQRALAWTYLRIRAKHFLTKLLPRYRPRQETICGLRLECLDYFTLAGMFEVIFLERDYEFTSGVRQPHIVDCGANIGLATLFFKRTFPDARITAFEPDPAAFGVLQRNVAVAGWDNVELINQAVSDSTGSSDFYFDPRKPGSDVASLRASSGLHGVQRVKTAKLSDYVHADVDFLKLDIEGAEASVIADLDASGKIRNVRQMAVEFHHHLAGHDEWQRVLTTLDRNAFTYTIKSSPCAPHAGQPCNSLIRAWRADAASKQT